MILTDSQRLGKSMQAVLPRPKYFRSIATVKTILWAVTGYMRSDQKIYNSVNLKHIEETVRAVSEL